MALAAVGIAFLFGRMNLGLALDLRRPRHLVWGRDHPRRLRVTMPCFQALTRPVSVMGLPLTYVIILVLEVMGGFVATLSFVYFVGASILGYAGLRALAAWDARIFDVIFTSLIRTPLPAAWFKSKGILYRV